ncbi:hypothetical protein [Helicobacter didelphidarum]|nr:hypothetical protein [Helicobacter didelphidarum]
MRKQMMISIRFSKLERDFTQAYSDIRRSILKNTHGTYLHYNL